MIDSTTLSLIANLGVGGVLAYVMFMQNRKDSSAATERLSQAQWDHAKRLDDVHREHAQRIADLVKLTAERSDAQMAFVEKQTVALTRVATVLDRIESRMEIHAPERQRPR